MHSYLWIDYYGANCWRNISMNIFLISVACGWRCQLWVANKINEIEYWILRCAYECFFLYFVLLKWTSAQRWRNRIWRKKDQSFETNTQKHTHKHMQANECFEGNECSIQNWEFKVSDCALHMDFSFNLLLELPTTIASIFNDCNVVIWWIEQWTHPFNHCLVGWLVGLAISRI